MASDDKSIRVGVITGAVGVRGDVRVKAFTDDPKDIAAYGPVTTGDGARHDIRVIRLSKDGVVARLDGVGDRDVALAMKGTELFVGRDALPESEDDEYYHADLIGLEARDLSGATLGRIKAVFDFGAGEMLELKLEKGGVAMLPFTLAAVPGVKIDEGYLLVDPPERVLPDPAEKRAKGTKGKKRTKEQGV